GVSQRRGLPGPEATRTGRPSPWPSGAARSSPRRRYGRPRMGVVARKGLPVDLDLGEEGRIAVEPPLPVRVRRWTVDGVEHDCETRVEKHVNRAIHIAYRFLGFGGLRGIEEEAGSKGKTAYGEARFLEENRLVGT